MRLACKPHFLLRPSLPLAYALFPPTPRSWGFRPAAGASLWSYAPTHDVAPRAVSIADAIDAISCTMNFAVSFLVIVVV